MKKEDISKVIEMILTSLNDEAKSQNNECEKCHSIGILNYRDTMSGKNEIINCDMCEGVGLLSIDVLLKKIKSQEDEIKSLRGTVNIFELSENEKLRIENKELKEKYAHSEDRISALEKLVSKSVYPIKLKGQEDIQNQEDLEFCIAGIINRYEGKIEQLVNKYENQLALEINYYKKEVERLNELLKEKPNENNISLKLNKVGNSYLINKKKTSFVSTDTNSVGMSNNKDSLTSLDKIKQKDPYLYKAINGLIEYISLCYSDKYYKDGNFTDMDKFMMESEYSDGFIIGNMAKYLTRYSGDLNKLVDLYKLIHYGLLSLRKKFKDNEK